MVCKLTLDGVLVWYYDGSGSEYILAAGTSSDEIQPSTSNKLTKTKRKRLEETATTASCRCCTVTCDKWKTSHNFDFELRKAVSVVKAGPILVNIILLSKCVS